MSMSAVGTSVASIVIGGQINNKINNPKPPTTKTK
jgi:hypothetical protein